MVDLHARLAVAERAAREAGEALRHHGRIQVRAKADNDYVTEMDVSWMSDTRMEVNAIVAMRTIGISRTSAPSGTLAIRFHGFGLVSW